MLLYFELHIFKD